MIKCCVRDESKDMAAPAAPETQRVDADNIRAQARAEAFGEVLTVIRQEGYAEFPDGKLLPSSEDVECIELAVKELAGGAEMSKQRRPAVDVEGLAKVLDYVLEMRSHLCDDPRRTYVARDLAETAVKFMGKNGGIP